MVEWRIFYDNDTCFDSTQGKPVDAPAFGIICIVQRSKTVGRTIMHGWDWYYHVPEEHAWWGSDTFGLFDRLLHRLPTEAVLQGRMVSRERFAEIMGWADKDPDFPPKSGRIAGERP